MRQISFILVFAMLVSFVSLAVVTLAPSASMHAQSTNEIVRFVDWNMNGSQLAVGYQNSQIEVFDVVTGIPLMEYSAPSSVMSLQWNPREPNLLSIGITDALNVTGSVEVLDTASGQTLASFDAGIPVTSVSWSPDGQRISAATANVLDSIMRVGEIKIWDITSGEQTDSIPAVTSGDFTTMSWSPSGDQIAAGTTDPVVIIWNVDSGEQVAELTGSTSPIYRLDWSPDGQRLASVSHEDNDLIWIWNTITGQEITRIPTHFPLDLDWDSTGSMIAIREPEMVRVVDAITGADAIDIPASWPHSGLSYSPYSARLAFGGIMPASAQMGMGEYALLGTLGDGLVQIVVPDPSPAGLEAVAIACNAPPAVVSTLTAAAEAEQFESLSALVEVLGVEELPPGCAADMRAVIEAMAAG